MSDKNANKRELPRVGADLLVECLEEHKVPYIFGIPGAKIDRVFDVLTYRGPELIVCRHEQNAGFMAAAIGRLTGSPGVCLATSGPGATNLATALATATTEGDPVVAITGAVPRSSRLKRSHQSMDTASVFRPITKSSIEVVAPSNIAEVVSNSFRIASAPRPGAVYITLPSDVLNAETDVQPIPDRGDPLRGPAHPTAVEEVTELLNKARLPVLFLGRAASEPSATLAVRRFLSNSPIPVVCTFEASGVVPRELLHCFVGRVGLFHNQPGDQLLDRADLILTVGYDEVEYDSALWHVDSKAKLIHLDFIEADIDGTYQPDAEVIGEIASTLDAIGRNARPAVAESETKLVATLQRQLWAEIDEGKTITSTPIHPLRFIHDLYNNLPDDVTVACDIGSVYVWMARYFVIHQPRHLLFSNGQQTLGVALPWAIAATLARPGKKVVSISGDGGFLFSAVELETAVRLRAPLVHFIWRDGSYDLVRIQQMMKYGRESGVRFGEPDLVKFAESFGAAAFRINSPDDLVPTLRKALEMQGPVIIDVPIDYRDNLKLGEQVKAHTIH
ncbi:MAG: acetolactate synthase AlsS [Candidatus Sumerlaeaceae bacterium]